MGAMEQPGRAHISGVQVRPDESEVSRLMGVERTAGMRGVD